MDCPVRLHCLYNFGFKNEHVFFIIINLDIQHFGEGLSYVTEIIFFEKY